MVDVGMTTFFIPVPVPVSNHPGLGWPNTPHQGFQFRDLGGGLSGGLTKQGEGVLRL